MIDKIDYTVYCVNEFARANSLSYLDAFDYLDKYQAIDYITDFYEFAAADEFDVAGHG